MNSRRLIRSLRWPGRSSNASRASIDAEGGPCEPQPFGNHCAAMLLRLGQCIDAQIGQSRPPGRCASVPPELPAPLPVANFNDGDPTLPRCSARAA
jgi:hypothetical protein